MTAPFPAFRFATEAQWNACLFVGADRQTAAARTGMRPYAPYELTPGLFASRGAYAPAASDPGDLLWRDDDGQLQRLRYAAAAPTLASAPGAIAAATRLVAAPGLLWAAHRAGRLEAFDIDSLSRLFSVDLPGELVDIAADGRGGVYALVAVPGGARIAHAGQSGEVALGAAVDADASALTYLLRARRFVLLADKSKRLVWIDAENGAALSSTLVSGLRPCFTAGTIGSDGCSRLLIAGTDGKPNNGRGQILIVDGSGDLIGTVGFDGVASGVTADRANLYVTTAAGLLRFEPAAGVPMGADEVRAELLTPALESAAQGAQRWTRIEVDAELTAGCVIEVSVASTASAAVRDDVVRKLTDPRVAPGQRLVHWRDGVEGIRTWSFPGTDSGPRARSIAVPLHDVPDSYLWVHVALTAAPGGPVPSLSALRILYPGPMLIENLPAIYRRGELETGNFLRRLVGVLEASTQDLDARIGELGRNIDARTAGREWLDFIARWMSLPWDDSLPLDLKRRIVSNGAALSSGHGTRAGLELLLACLMPEMPRRFKVIDLTADLGLATLGGDMSGGCRLPALLGGLPRSATELGAKAILGQARLPCDTVEGETARLLGRVRIELAVDAREQASWATWLPALIDAMLPATVRAELRWLARGAFARRGELRDGLTLDDDPAAELGSEAITGQARLAGLSRSALPDRIDRGFSLH